jgi:hypothetical protein
MRIGHQLGGHVESDNFQILGQRSRGAHGILFDRCQDTLVLEHVLGGFGVSQLKLDAIEDHGLQRIVHAVGKGAVNGFSKLALVPSHVNMPQDGLTRSKNIVPRRPQATAHNDFFAHENPRQKGVKRHFAEKFRMRHEITGRGEGSKCGILVLFLFKDTRSSQSHNLRFQIRTGENGTTDATAGRVGFLVQIDLVSRRIV